VIPHTTYIILHIIYYKRAVVSIEMFPGYYGRLIVAIYLKTVVLIQRFFTKVSQKVPGMVVLQCNGRTMVLKQHIHTCFNDPATVGSTGGKLLFDSPEIGSRVPSGAFKGCETCPIEAHS
jgi:hypothetical protein